MKEFFYKEIEEGESVDWWLGFAWRNWNRRSAVAILIPFNHVARWARDLWWWLRKPRPSFTDKLFERYDEGYKDGQENTRRFYENKMKKQNEEWSRTVGLAILAEREKLTLLKNER